MQGVILVKNQGQVLPKPLIEKVLGQNPSVMGVMFVGDKGILIDKANTDLPTVDDFMENQEKNKDPCVLFYFGYDANPVSDDSIQPFELLRDTDGVLLAMMAEGEYASQGKPESTHSDEMHFCDDYIRPSINALLKQYNGDVDKVFAHLNTDPLFKKNIDQCSINRGVVIMFTVDGEIMKFQKGNDREWSGPEGWASNHCGFVEQSSQETVPAPAAEEKKVISVSGFTRKSKPSVPAVADTKSVTQKKEEEKGTTVSAITNTTVEKPKTDTAVDKTPQRPMISCPPGIKGKEAIKKWYVENCTHVPEKFKEHIEAPANDEWMAKNAGKYKPFDEGLKEMKDKVKDAKASPPVLPDPPLVVAPDRKTAINNLINGDRVKAMIDQNKVLDPNDLKNPKVANFIQQMGWELTDLYRWDSRVVKLVLDQMDQQERANFTLALIQEHMSLLVGEGKSPETVKVTETKAEEATSPKINMSGFFKRKTG